MNPHDLALAYALSTIAGLRASLTIAAVSLGVHLHWIAVPASLHWLGTDATLGIAAVLAVAELVADKIPIVDHGLHALHFVLAPLAGGTAALAADPTNSASAATTVAIVAGANALGITGLRAAARGASTTFSMGMLNPIVSLVEDVLAIGALVATFFIPVAVATVALILTVVALFALRRILAAAAARKARVAA